LKRALDRAEVRHDHPPLAHCAVEEILAERLVGARILEDAVAGDARRLDAGTFEQLSRQRPADFWSVTSTLAALKASVRARKPATVVKLPAVRVDLEQQVLPFCAVMPDPHVGERTNKKGGRSRPLTNLSCPAEAPGIHTPLSLPRLTGQSSNPGFPSSLSQWLLESRFRGNDMQNAGGRDKPGHDEGKTAE
jgi:hypothetical protein